MRSRPWLAHVLLHSVLLVGHVAAQSSGDASLPTFTAGRVDLKSLPEVAHDPSVGLVTVSGGQVKLGVHFPSFIVEWLKDLFLGRAVVARGLVLVCSVGDRVLPLSAWLGRSPLGARCWATDAAKFCSCHAAILFMRRS